jgi:transposase
MQLGHEVRLIPPAYVKPLVKRHKNDAVDAEVSIISGSRCSRDVRKEPLALQAYVRLPA